MSEGLDWLPFVVSVLLVGLPALAGAAMIFYAVRRWLRVRELASSGRPATARVVDNQVVSGSNGGMTFRPVVEFRTEAGQQVTAVLGDLGGPESHLAGTEIAVFYDTATPTEATPAGKGGTSRLITAIVFGLLFLGFSLLAYKLTGEFRSEFADFGDPGVGEPISSIP